MRKVLGRPHNESVKTALYSILFPCPSVQMILLNDAGMYICIYETVMRELMLTCEKVDARAV